MAKPVKNPPHDCPGGCGAQVPHHLLACRDCWYLLPAALRMRVSNGDRDTRLSAVSEALVWYRDNCREAVSPDDHQ